MNDSKFFFKNTHKFACIENLERYLNMIFGFILNDHVIAACH